MTIKQKNLVICLDGTGNQIEENLSNVLKLYRTLEKNDEQLVFYDQGVGTLKRTLTWGRRKQQLKHFLGLAFGYGLDRNVLNAYEFLIQNYSERKTKAGTLSDCIYIFGFSRGAHTARVLAGLIYEIGILRPEQIHLSKAALMAYKQSARKSADDKRNSEGVNFRRVVQPRVAAVKFLGVFDTVSSVFVPNSKGYWPPLVREKLPHTCSNPAVENFRHAVSIDERRRMFRLDGWDENQNFQPNRHSQAEPQTQDAKEVWFSGYHSDVGGGHERMDSGISQYPLIWMLGEAGTKGIKVFDRMAQYVSGVKPYSSKTKYFYPSPDVMAPHHDSMSWIWKTIEFAPKSVRFQEWPDRNSKLGYYFPSCEPRRIPDSAEIHASVQKRVANIKAYEPVNIPKS